MNTVLVSLEKLKHRYNSLDCNNYFSSPSWSAYHLLILLTTANFPDVMLPTYKCSGSTAWFFVVFLLVGLYLLLNLVTAIVYAHYSGHVRDLLHIHTKRRGTAMNRVYRILSNSYGVYSKKEKQIPKTPSNVLSHVSVDTKAREEEEKISQNDHDTIELAALSPQSRRGKAISFKDDEDDREVRGVRAWSSRMSLFHVSVMLLKLRKREL